MNIDYRELPYDVQVRIYREKLATVAEMVPELREMRDIMRSTCQHIYHQVTTRQIVREGH